MSGELKSEAVGEQSEHRKQMQCEKWIFNGEKWVSEKPKVRRQIRSHLDLDIFHLAYTWQWKCSGRAQNFLKRNGIL